MKFNNNLNNQPDSDYNIYNKFNILENTKKLNIILICTLFCLIINILFWMLFNHISSQFNNTNSDSKDAKIVIYIFIMLSFSGYFTIANIVIFIILKPFIQDLFHLNNTHKFIKYSLLTISFVSMIVTYSTMGFVFALIIKIKQRILLKKEPIIS